MVRRARSAPRPLLLWQGFYGNSRWVLKGGFPSGGVHHVNAGRQESKPVLPVPSGYRLRKGIYNNCSENSLLWFPKCTCSSVWFSIHPFQLQSQARRGKKIPFQALAFCSRCNFCSVTDGVLCVRPPCFQLWKEMQLHCARLTPF